MELPEVPEISSSLRPSSQSYCLWLDLLYPGLVSQLLTFLRMGYRFVPACSNFYITNYFLISKHKTLFLILFLLILFTAYVVIAQLFFFFFLQLSFSRVCVIQHYFGHSASCLLAFFVLITGLCFSCHPIKVAVMTQCSGHQLSYLPL